MVQISDTHPVRVARDFIQHALDRAIALQPDVFVLTGDYVHCGLEWLDPAAEQLACLVRTGIPTIAVRGNHDWFNNGERLGDLLRDRGIHVIDNRRLFLARKRRRRYHVHHAATRLPVRGGPGRPASTSSIPTPPSTMFPPRFPASSSPTIPTPPNTIP